ncbi:hypothetical protein GCM10027047_00190 [Rhodococcus aerolatus]
MFSNIGLDRGREAASVDHQPVTFRTPAPRDFDTDADEVGTDTGGENGTELGLDDLAVDPRTDAEALALCALLWSPAADARLITTTLVPLDFYEPRYCDLFELIASHVSKGIPHDPASIAAAITAKGDGPDHRGTRLLRGLADVTTAGADPETASHYALAVAGAAYRRGFHTAATRLAQAATELPESELFTHLLAVGRQQRTATQRLVRIRSALGG